MSYENTSVYDAMNPIRSGIMMPCPRPKVEGLNETQARAKSRMTMVGAVLGAKSVGGAEGLGMMSTIAISRHGSPVVSTHAGKGEAPVRSGGRRKSPKMKTRSLCHLAKGETSATVQAKVDVRRKRDRNHEIDRCFRKAQRAIKLRDRTVLDRMVKRLEKLDRSMLKTLIQWASYRETGMKLRNHRANTLGLLFTHAQPAA